MSHKIYASTAQSLNLNATPQSSPIPGRESEMVQNYAGGFVFGISKWAYLNRFLILGTESSTLHVSNTKLTADAAENVVSCIAADGKRTVDTVVAISEAGRAPKNDPALFVLAMCAGLGDDATRKHALEMLPRVARIGTHLFHFAEYVQQFRGWGHGLRKGIANWYTEKKAEDLAFQLAKYQSRDGWSHRDLIRLSHPKVKDEASNRIIKWSVGGWDEIPEEHNLYAESLGIIWAFEKVKQSTDEKEIISLIQKYHLPLEMIPSEKQTKKVLSVALEFMGLTALLRNLGRFTSIGVLEPMSDSLNYVIGRLSNEEQLKKARIHPISLLSALAIYSQGHGERGSLSWKPIQKLVDTLDESYYTAFGTIVPTGKRIMFALDVSGSMGSSKIAGMSHLSARMGSAALAMALARTEKDYLVTGFTSGVKHQWNSSNKQTGVWHGYNYANNDGITHLDISPKMRLDSVIEEVSRLPFGGTDCALPMLYAMEKKFKFDAFVVITDNETWAGQIQPAQALQKYRDAMGIDAKLVVIAMEASNATIADPKDGGMLDVVGFDGSTPQIISDFIMGKV